MREREAPRDPHAPLAPGAFSAARVAWLSHGALLARDARCLSFSPYLSMDILSMGILSMGILSILPLITSTSHYTHTDLSFSRFPKKYIKERFSLSRFLRAPYSLLTPLRSVRRSGYPLSSLRSLKVSYYIFFVYS